MNMKQLRYVLALAREGSFSRAAESLGITQPSLSQYIKKVETEQGVRLFDRTGGDVRLTDAGRVYVDAGRRILDMEQQLERRIEDLTEFRSGSIVVGASPHRCIYLMPEIVKRFQKLYPGMHLVIEERWGASLLDDAEHGEFDLCIANLPVDDRIFRYELMMKEEVLLAVKTDTPLCERLRKNTVKTDGREYPAVDFRELAGEPFVTLAETQPTQKRLDEICSEVGFEVHPAAECRTIETQIAMVKAGIGMALVPSGIARNSTADGISYFSFIQSIPYRDMAVVYRREQYLSRAVRDLIGIMTSL